MGGSLALFPKIFQIKGALFKQIARPDCGPTACEKGKGRGCIRRFTFQWVYIFYFQEMVI